MEAILQGLLELGGVNAALVLDADGRVLAQLGKAIYDAALFEQVAGLLARTFDSVQLQHEDWELITAQFADGRLLARNVGVVPEAGPCVLVLIGDTTINAPFATVAIRVAVTRLRRGPDAAGRAAPSRPPYAPATSPRVPPSVSGFAPPKTSSSGILPPTLTRAPPPPPPSARPPPPFTAPSGLVGATPDPASTAFLTRCCKELAPHLGPMAKVIVDEAVRALSPGQPFSMTLSSTLVDHVANQIESPKGRAAFLASLRSTR